MVVKLLAWSIHEQATAVADSSKNTGRAPSGCSTCCRVRLRALQSALPVFLLLSTTSLRFFMNNPG